MFKHRQRVNAAFAKGLMFGKAVGARDERDRIIALLNDRLEKAQATASNYGQITAMREPISIEAVEALTEAFIYAIKGENK